MFGSIFKWIKRARKINKAISEGKDVVKAIEFLYEKYDTVDDDAAWAWKEINEFKNAVGDIWK